MVDMGAFLRRFAEESLERLSDLEAGLARLEAAPGDGAAAEEIMRQAHTIKGGARMLRLTEVQDVAHAFEEALSDVVKGRRPADPSSMDAFFAATAGLRTMVERLLGGDPGPPVSAAALCAALTGAVTPPPRAPTGGGADDGDRPGLPPSAATPAPIMPSARGQSVRVAVTRLDALGTLVVEQSVEDSRARRRHARLERLGLAVSRVKGAVAGTAADPALRAALQDLERGHRRAVEEDEDAAARRAAISDELREHVQALRLTPLSVLLDAFPASVREIARGFGKDVDLVVEGASTEIDRRIVDEIGEPLVHLLRNSLDHGIESPAERAAAGKPHRGTIRITARAAEGSILLDVEDDGRGIDPVRIRETAARRGVMSAEEAARLGDEQALDLVFMPGFSTREKAGEISGRGVGMDSVRVSVSRLGGAVEIRSSPGGGTRVGIRLPLTLALLRVLLFRVGEETLAIPLSALDRVGSFALLHLLPATDDDEPLPIVSMAEALGLPADGRGDAPPTYLVLRGAGSRAVFIVDEVIEETEVALKQAPRLLRGSRLVSGVTLLATGLPAVVLEPSELIARALTRRVPPAR